MFGGHICGCSNFDRSCRCLIFKFGGSKLKRSYQFLQQYIETFYCLKLLTTMNRNMKYKRRVLKTVTTQLTL